MPDLSSIPTWGLFAVAVLYMVFQFMERMEKIRAEKKRRSMRPPSVREDTGTHITADQVAAVVRDQHERQEILEALRTTNQLLHENQATDKSTLEVLKQQSEILQHQDQTLRKLESGYDLLSKAQDRQTKLLSDLIRLVENQQQEIHGMSRDLQTVLRHKKRTVPLQAVVEKKAGE